LSVTLLWRVVTTAVTTVPVITEPIIVCANSLSDECHQVKSSMLTGHSGAVYCQLNIYAAAPPWPPFLRSIVLSNGMIDGPLSTSPSPKMDGKGPKCTHRDMLNFEWPYLHSWSSDPLYVWIVGRVFEVNRRNSSGSVRPQDDGHDMTRQKISTKAVQ